MTAKVEILVDELKDVIYVPIQAVFAEEKEQVCYPAGRKPERRVIETGQYNDEFIEIKSGLEQNELVLLKAPKGQDQGPALDGESAENDEALSNKPSPEPAAPIG